MKEKSVLFILSLVMAFIFGVVMILSPSEPAKYTFAFLFLYLFIWRVFIDAAEYNFKRNKLFNISLIMFTYITFPYYLFKTRGLIKGLLSIIRIILFIVLFFVVMLIGASLIIMTQGGV